MSQVKYSLLRVPQAGEPRQFNGHDNICKDHGKLHGYQTGSQLHRESGGESLSSKTQGFCISKL